MLIKTCKMQLKALEKTSKSILSLSYFAFAFSPFFWGKKDLGGDSEVWSQASTDLGRCFPNIYCFCFVLAESPMS